MLWPFDLIKFAVKLFARTTVSLVLYVLFVIDKVNDVTTGSTLISIIDGTRFMYETVT